MKGISRRWFLGMVTGIATALGTLGPFKAFAMLFKEKWIPVGSVDDFEVGSASVIEDEKLFIFRDEMGFHAMTGKCTHFGCLVERVEDGTFECPCHGARYDELGRVVRGPAKDDLVWHEVKEEGGELFVNVKGVVEPPGASASED
jgi:nitrite reductase/ring-hydroxylating ferredoxin subunit